MRIAYITYEYPPDLGLGGIATYTLHAAFTMSMLGHHVEVFCGSPNRELTEIYEGVTTHRIKVSGVDDFRKKVLSVFSIKHEEIPFDIVESPEINGNGFLIKKKYPELPFTVKLHTPAVLQVKILNTYVPFKSKMRFFLGALKRGKWDLGYWSKHDKNQNNDIDFKISQIADSISSPSISLKQWAIDFWKISPEKISVLPYPFFAKEEYFRIPIEMNTDRITLIGKLNIHKGLVSLTKAIPLVIKKNPRVKFRFVGNDGDSHVKGMSMKEFMLNSLTSFRSNLEFIDGVPLTDIPNYLKDTDICVFPSVWDNFPLVCMEAMAAGRAIAASNQGGMRDMLEHTNAGLLFDSMKPKAIAEALNFYIENKSIAQEYAKRARERVLSEYNYSKIGKEMEDYYSKIIENKKH